MSVCSIEFLLLLLLVSAAFFWLPGVRSRQVLLALCNAGFLYSLVPDAIAWVALGLVLGTGYAVTKVLLVHPRRPILAAYLGLLLAAFLILKQYEFVRVLLPASLFERTVAVVGLSYMLFRQIHVLVDALQGQIEGFSLWTYLNYQLNLFGLLAGPIQRYQEFQQCWDRLEPILTDGYQLCRAYLRVFVGVVKIVVAATACLAMYDRLADGLAHGTPTETLTAGRAVAKFLLLFYLYPAYIYFNFSGYCDMVIGGASLLGLKMPENFDWPFLSRNMIEYLDAVAPDTRLLDPGLRLHSHVQSHRGAMAAPGSFPGLPLLLRRLVLDGGLARFDVELRHLRPVERLGRVGGKIVGKLSGQTPWATGPAKLLAVKTHPHTGHCGQLPFRLPHDLLLPGRPE